MHVIVRMTHLMCCAQSVMVTTIQAQGGTPL